MLCKQGDIPRIESFGFVESMTRFAPIALAGVRRKPATQEFGCYWEERTRLLKVTHSRVVVLQTGIVVKSLGQYGLAEVGLKSERDFQLPARFFTSATVG